MNAVKGHYGILTIMKDRTYIIVEGICEMVYTSGRKNKTLPLG